MGLKEIYWQNAVKMTVDRAWHYFYRLESDFRHQYSRSSDLWLDILVTSNSYALHLNEAMKSIWLWNRPFEDYTKA